MKILFMGTPDYAAEILKALIKEVEVVAVFTQPDKPVGRKKVLTAPIVKNVALENGIDVYQPKRLRDEVELVKSFGVDFIVVAAYGQILPKEIIDFRPCINLHASLLPLYRGASPIQESLLNGDKVTGITAMLMDEGLDTGAILYKKEIEIFEDEMVESLFNRLTQLAKEVTIDVLNKFSELKPILQDDSIATHCKKIAKEDGKINFNNAQAIYNRYRAFTPWPGIFLESGLKIKKIALEEKSGTFIAGQILNIDNDSVVIGCESGKLRIFEVQPPSKKSMNIIDYLRGKRLSDEDILA